ncbi:AAA family ATPase [Lentzea sp. NPDC042327]|uniref:AAA family ATPase n=1 Tax=Lentzea sp. NPDC042327 TaxID=3154801 RepID=UPI0033D6B22B
MARIFGRTRELASLHEAFVESTRGNGLLVLVSGTPGSGKTQVLDEFLISVRESGARILHATADPASRDRPLSLARNLLKNSGTACPELWSEKHDHIVSDRVHPPREKSEEVDFPTAELEASAEALLGRADEDCPLVLAVDDAHLMDAWSTTSIVHLLQRGRFRKLLVVCTLGIEDDASRTVSSRQLNRHPHRRIRLAPLSAAELAELLAADAGGPPSEELTTGFSRMTAGVPLLAHALLDDCKTRGALVERPVAGAAYRNAVLQLLHRNSSEKIHVLRLLALFGESVQHLSDTIDSVNLSETMGVSDETVSNAVDRGNSTGLLTGRRFLDPAAAAAVREDMRPDLRTTLHCRIAEALYNSGAPAEVVASHLLAAELVPAGWGTSTLRSAAEAALGRDDLERCAACLQLALRGCSGTAESHEITAALARVEWLTNPAAAGRRLDPLRQAAEKGELDLRDATTVLRHVLWQGDTELAGRIAEALPPPVSSADELVRQEVDMIRQWFYGAGEPAGPSRSNGHPDKRRTMYGIMAPLSALLNGVDTAESTTALAQCLQGHRLDDLNLEIVAMSLLAIAYAGQPALAGAACEGLLESAVARRAKTWQAILGSVQAEVARLQGDLPAALTGAREAVELLAPQGWGVLIGLPLSTALFANPGLGAIAHNEQLLNLPVPKPMYRTVFGVQYLRARGHHYLETAQPFAALNDFETSARLIREGNSQLQRGIPWRTDLAMAYLRLGKTRTARTLAEEELRRSRTSSANAQALALRVLAATSKPYQRAPLLHQSIDLLKACGDRQSLAHAYAELASAHYEFGEFARARLVAKHAAREAEACRMVSPVDQHLLEDAEPTASDSDQRGTVLLSDAERRVAHFAVLGYTNREISDRLHVTISTVEQHLTRVYRKLNVAKRSELPSDIIVGEQAQRQKTAVD